MDKDDFLRLFAKKLADGLTASEQLDYDLYLVEHKQEKEISLLLERFYLEPKRNESTNKDKLDSIWKKIDAAESPTTKTKNYRKMVFLFGSIAAALLIFVLICIKYFNPTDIGETVIQESGTKIVSLVLKDGTKVTLDKHATLSYNSNYGKDNRELLLHGTAFFDVAKDTLHPMRITVGDWKVNVVGTSFTIKPNLSKDESELVLYNGKVQLIHNDSPDHIFTITPGEKAVWKQKAPKGVPSLAINRVSPRELEFSRLWTQDSIIFKNQPLKDLMEKVGKTYGMKVIFENKKLMDAKFTGAFASKNLKINELLHALKVSYPFEYEIRDSVIFLR
ncbi:FecR family protein [Sphingobacterium detergens]